VSLFLGGNSCDRVGTSTLFLGMAAPIVVLLALPERLFDAVANELQPVVVAGIG
jgi:hypothetical protein